MKVNQFEAHPLWSRLSAVEGWLEEMRAEDGGENVDTLDELMFRAAHLRAAFKTRRRLAPFMVQQQLDSVDANYQNVVNAVSSAFSAGKGGNRTQYLSQAIVYSDATAMAQVNWPQPLPTPADERAEVAVIDELMRKRAEVDDYVRERIDAVERELASTDEKAVAVTAEVAKADDDLTALVSEATAAVEAEKNRIATVIDDGTKKIAGFEGLLNRHLSDWQSARTKELDDRLGEQQNSQRELLAESKRIYVELTRTVDDYQALVQLDSADRLAKHYETEADDAEKAGWRTTIAGFVILLAAGLPLLIVILQPLLNAWLGWSLRDPSWETLATRGLFAAVLVGAATVAIRIGGGYLKRSADYKRLAMELRTMGPFLSGVKDEESKDQARLDLVNRTFGQAYAPPSSEKAEDAIPVGVLQQLLTLLTRTVGK